MAHYAYLNENNVVYAVIVGKDENENGIDWEQYYGAKRTSYNTKGGIYYDSKTGQPTQDQSKSFRKNFASEGYTYDPIRDAFIPPKKYNSWTLNEDSCIWVSPVPYPDENQIYFWDEETLTWKTPEQMISKDIWNFNKYK
jgi:hypothetical protein